MVAVIGDIHGCYKTLTELVDKIRNKYNNVSLYCVGDLVDRGNFSFEVLEYVINEKITFTPGNHDYMFYYFIKEPLSEIGRTWLYNGYENTLKSYESRMEKVSGHLNLIIQAPLFINLPECFISHAGISKYYKSKLPKNFKSNLDLIKPVIENDLLNDYSILWTRDELLDIGKLQVLGHTRQNDVTYLKSSNALYIDTSVYTGNKLSAVIVENNKVIETLSVNTYPEDIY
jgi:serine/threonine protein phosphatase 1